MNIALSTSLRAKILLPLAMIMILVGALSALSFGRRLDSALIEELGSKGRALAKSLASSAQETILSRDASTIQGFIDEYKGIRGVGYVYVVSGSGEILAHTFTPTFPREILTIAGAPLESAKITQSQLTWRQRHFLDIQAPLLGGSLGYAHVGMDLDQAKVAGMEAFRSVMLGTFFLGLFGFGLVFLIVNQSIRQIIQLSVLSRKIAEDDRSANDDVEKEQAYGADEIGVLAGNFFTMVSQLRAQKENLEHIVRDRTKELLKTNESLAVENSERKKIEAALRLESRYMNTLQRSAVAANESESPEEALRSALQIVISGLNFSVGHVFLVEQGPNGAKLKCSGIWHHAVNEGLMEFQHAWAGEDFAAGVGLPGQALVSKKVIYVSNLSEDTSSPRMLAAKKVGLRGAVAIPVLIDEQVFAILEFSSFTEIPMEGAFENVMANVGLQVSRVFERMHAKELLERQREKLVAGAKMISLGEMAGGVAHEINNPLAIISTTAWQIEDLLAEEPFQKPLIQQRVMLLIKATERIAKIVQGLRTFSRDGSSDPFCNVDVSTLIEETLSFCRERLQKHGVKLTVGPIP
jgi:HAMP domain-containing protein